MTNKNMINKNITNEENKLFDYYNKNKNKYDEIFITDDDIDFMVKKIKLDDINEFLIVKNSYNIIKNNYYKIDEDDFVSNVNFTDTILNEITLSKNKNLVDDIENDKLYLIRIWIKYTNTWKYKLGTTKNLRNRIKELNNYYDCCGKIILVFCVNITNTNIEKKFHKILSKYRNTNNNITNPLKSKSRELYNISSNFYDKLLNLINELSDNFFESEDYILDSDNCEHYRLDKEGIVFFQKNNIKCDNTGHIILDYNNLERLFWIYQRDI